MAVKQKILVVDDDSNIAELICLYLVKEGFETEKANNGKEALRQIQRFDPNLVILDVMMPEMDGYETCREIRKQGNTPVIFLTAKGETFDKVLGLELGADDYVQKPCPPRELVARINAILRRSATAWAAAAPVIVGPVTIDPAQRSVNSAAGPIALTGTEFSLFELLARHAGTPVPKEEIYPKVLGRPMGPYDRAIDVHVSAIRHKVSAVIGKKIAIESIRGVGYQLVIHPDA